MKIARLAGLVVLGVLAMSLAATSIASATLPKFNTTKVTFTGSQSGTSKLGASKNTISCTANTTSGEITQAMLVGGVVIHYTGCTSSGATKTGCAANSIGAASGLIETKTLEGILGEVLTSDAAGLELLPVSGKTFVEIAANECTVETAVSGTVAGLISPTGKPQTTGKIILNAPSESQEITEIDTLAGASKPKLTAFSATAFDETSEAITFAKAVEVT
jgi:hypothetical protein